MLASAAELLEHGRRLTPQGGVMTMPRWTGLGLALALVLTAAACAGRAPTPPASGGAAESPQAPASDSAAAWRHLATVNGTLRDGSAAVAVEDAEALARTWADYGFDGAPPTIDFGPRFVLFVLQPDDACPDELIGLEVTDGRLQVEWLPPPGGCQLPLILRIHAVDVHRGHVPAAFTVALDEPYATEAEPAQIQLTPYDGEPAPPPPAPPRAMTEAEVDAVFDGHAVRRCTPEDDVVPPLPPGAVVDERNEAAEEALMGDLMAWLQDQGWDLNREVVPIMDRHDNLRPHLRVNADRAERLQRQVDREFGDGAVVVDANPYDLAAIAAAQEALTPLMGGDGPGSIWASSGIPGPVKLSMADPTREALDAVAATVDPALVCVDVELSGVR
jgi:hypothetical protein